MSLAPDVLRTASEPYRAAGRLAYHFARGKLGRDPVFATIVARGLLSCRARILDLGCGQGLLAACLFAARGRPASPLPMSFRGIDVVGRYVARARIALGHQAHFAEDDVRRADFGTADGIVILDVLHYIEYADQAAVLERVHRALAEDGVLLVRVGDAAGGLGFRMGRWVDQMVLLMSGRGLQRLHHRRVGEWRDLLSSIGFDVETLPMSTGTPFANVLFIARRRSLAG